jgi:hypothetical protein
MSEMAATSTLLMEELPEVFELPSWKGLEASSRLTPPSFFNELNISFASKFSSPCGSSSFAAMDLLVVCVPCWQEAVGSETLAVASVLPL